MNQQRTDIDQNRTDIDSNDVDIAALDSRLTTAEGDIDNLEADYVSKTLPQTVAGTKTFSDPTVISDTTSSTNKDTGALVVEGGLGVEENVNIGGDATVTGNLTVNGTTTTVNSSVLDVTDANITINKGGNQSGADNQSGITVEMSDATNGSILYDKDVDLRWRMGDQGSEIEVSGVIYDTEANILALGSPSTSVFYKATDTGKTFFYDSVGAEFKEVGAGEGGGTGVGSPDTLFVDNAENASLADPEWTGTSGGWSISQTDPINGTSVFLGVHDGVTEENLVKTFTIPPKFRGKNISMYIDANSGASTGNVTLTVDDLTNATTLISGEQLDFSTDVNSSRKSLITFDVPDNCTSIAYEISLLVEGGSPETRVDDITFQLTKRETTEISQVKQETNVFSAIIQKELRQVGLE
jgi:hypothetical protein